MMLLSFGEVHITMLRLVMRTSSIFNSQYVATRCNRVAKCMQHVAPTVLRSVAFNCCDRLGEACQCWTNSVGMCCVEILLSFGRGLKGHSQSRSQSPWSAPRHGAQE